MNPTFDCKPSLEFLAERFSRMPSRTHNPSIVEYAETTMIPSGPFRGTQFEHRRAPQLTEPLSLLSPDSPYREIVLMTPAQFGKSTIAELTTMYYVAQAPSEIMYVSSNETAAEKWLERRIVPRANAAGIEFKIEVENKTRRKSGDTSISKTFPGGNIDIASALSPAQLSSETKRIVLGDEVDRWNVVLGAEGSVVDMIRARTQAWGSQAKILWISTPTLESVSLIYQMFLTGDQRYYYVPCPYCGHMQLMDFSYDKGHGLKWEYKDGKINRHSIELICESQTCGKGIKESSKNAILNAGEWRATAASEYDYIASYTINGLYSHMLTWYDMVVASEEARKNSFKKQAFDNLKMGRPHRGMGQRPKVERLIENRGKYRSGEVPEGVLYLTIGIDVQRGSAKDPDNPPRLEMEVMGTGVGYRTWSIEYKRFDGDVDDAFSGAWEKLHQYALNNNLQYIRRIDGFVFPVSLTFIDSGFMTDVVYKFTQRWTNCFPSKGRGIINKRKNEKGDIMTENSFKRYRPVKLDEGSTMYEISTVLYKNDIYNSLKIDRQPVEPQKPNFCDFPIDYPEKYFQMLTAEECLSDGSYHDYGRRNEALDCRVYALCAAHVFLDSELLSYRAVAKSRNMKAADIQQITHRTVLAEMEKQTARKDKRPVMKVFSAGNT